MSEDSPASPPPVSGPTSEPVGSTPRWKPSTVAVKAGRPEHRPDQPLNEPIVMASTYVAGGDLEYGRYGNPTWTAFEEALGALEGGRCLSFASGLAAVATVLDLVGRDAKVVAPRHAYNGTVLQLGDLEARGRLQTELVDVTDTAAVVAACEEAVAKAPQYGHAHWSAAQFGRKEGASERIARMREVLQRDDLDNDSVTYLQYGLFKELDTLGDTEAAWEALMAGAAARRSVTFHDVATETAAFDALIEATPASWIAQCADVPQDVTPIFVVGMPRTGTTLLERILGNHPAIETCGELNDFRQQMQWANNLRMNLTLTPEIGPYVAGIDADIVGNRYLSKTRHLTRNKAFFSDKHPINMLWCGPIMKALPHAKIIHLRRNPMDACFSNLKELFAHHYYPYSYALDELAAHYRNYDRLMRHWHAAAPGRILDVRYEDLVTQPEREAQRVQEYLGLPALDGVTDILANKKVTTTASTLQLRQPIHTRNVGGWKRYATGLVPLEAQLQDLVQAYRGESAAAA